MAILGNLGFFLIPILKHVSMFYWKGICEGFGDNVLKIPMYEFARRKLWVLF